jgi:transcriptional regulator with XRE-family HTH domain
VLRKRLREGRHVSTLIDPAGTRRRLRALAALGWPQRELAERLGMTKSAVGQLGVRHGRVNQATAGRIAELYEALCMTIGPSKRARDRAARNRWAPPLAWAEGTIDNPDAKPIAVPGRHHTQHVDPVVVARLRNGDRPRRVTRAEHHAAIAEMTGRGDTAAVIAARVGTTPRSVTRTRRTTRPTA